MYDALESKLQVFQVKKVQSVEVYNITEEKEAVNNDCLFYLGETIIKNDFELLFLIL